MKEVKLKLPPTPEMAERNPVPIRWDAHGVPCSELFNDKYFCSENGLEESFHVCCLGNRLPDRFAALNPEQPGTFTIMETGFGTGLDFCRTWQAWEEKAPRAWKLHFLSLELYPLSADQIARALGVWPSLARYRDALVACYRPQPGEVGQFVFDEGRIRLTVVFRDVVEALELVRQKKLAPDGADAWFLDGFGPACNPRMWCPEVFAAMAPLSKTGTTFSTFTVAGAVRRGLMAAGFSVQKISGHGKKRQILTGAFRL